MPFFGLEKFFKIIVDSNRVKDLYTAGNISCNDGVMVSMADILQVDPGSFPVDTSTFILFHMFKLMHKLFSY